MLRKRFMVIVAAMLAAGVVTAMLVTSGAATPTARAGSLTQGLSAYVVATNKGPLPACSEDGSDCTSANLVWDYIHVVNRNPLVNQGGSRLTVPNAFAIDSIDESVSVNGVSPAGLRRPLDATAEHHTPRLHRLFSPLARDRRL